MIVLQPDRYLLPDYKISPFETRDIARQAGYPRSSSARNYFRERFGHNNFWMTSNGRHAIRQILAHYALRPDDSVTIFTTTGNSYVSGCVMSEIEKVCRWNREVDHSTRLLFVIHEFGYPFPDPDRLKSFGLPIVEDSAYSFFTTTEKYPIGTLGDFCLYSFPKMFPVQVGGLIVSNKGVIAAEGLPKEWEADLWSSMSVHLDRREEIIHRRVHNYRLLASSFGLLGLEPRFSEQPGTVPGVFMFRSPKRPVNWQSLRSHVERHGIQCSVFYGEDAFFIPAHDRLEEEDIAYFAVVVKAFLDESSRNPEPHA